MKPALAEDYKNQDYLTIARGVRENPAFQNKKLPFVATLDAVIMHYKPWTNIVFNPNVKSAWKTILEAYFMTDEYKALNEAVAGDPMLSKYATIHFLNTLLKKSEEELEKADPVKKDAGDPIQSLVDAIDSNAVSPFVAKRTVQEIANALRQEAAETLRDAQTAQGFTHLGIPVANLMEKPDEFRRKARDRIIVSFIRLLQKFRRDAPSLKHARTPTLVGGRPLGVKRIQRWSELTGILPVDYIDSDLLDYRIASRSVRVPEHYGNLQDYYVYIDKSGSMSGFIEYTESPTNTEHVPKISYAAASAIALAEALRRAGGRMTLKFFDVDVHDPITDYAQVIDALLRIEADSGTNITKVIEDAMRYKNGKIIVITDGIDDIDEGAVKKAKAEGLDLSCIFIDTDNELLSKNFPCEKVEKAKPGVLLRV